VVGELSSEATVTPADPTPQPAGPGSWPPSPQPRPFGGWEAQLWSKKQAKPTKSDGPEIL
jgi:hypothetical protein